MAPNGHPGAFKVDSPHGGMANHFSGRGQSSLGGGLVRGGGFTACAARRLAAAVSAVVVCMAAAVAATKDNRLSAPLDCYLRDELETSGNARRASPDFADRW